MGLDLTLLATKDDLARLATKDELRAEFAALRADIATLWTEIASSGQQQTVWTVGAIFVVVGATIALQRILPPAASAPTVETSQPALPQAASPPARPAKP